MMSTTTRSRRQSAGVRGRGLAGRLVRNRRGQAISEYVALSGVIAVIVIASMTIFTRPVALAFAALFRRMVLYMTSTS